MALFARELRHAAYDMDDYLYFIALVELVKRKGSKKPVKFVLYRFVLYRDPSKKSDCKMVRMPAHTIKASVEACWLKTPEEVEQEVVSGDLQWEETTRWLTPLVVDSWYQPHLRNTWVKVSEPKHRKRRPLSDLEARAREKRIKKADELLALNRQRNVLWQRRQYLVGRPGTDGERRILSQRIFRIEREMISMQLPRRIDQKFDVPFRRIHFVRRRQLALVALL